MEHAPRSKVRESLAARTTGTKVRDWPLLHRPPIRPDKSVLLVA